MSQVVNNDSIQGGTTVLYGKRFLIYGVLVPLSLGAYEPQYTNKLTKVFHHKGKLSDKVVCYFSSNPIWNQIPHLNNGTLQPQVQVTYFLPKVTLASREVQSAIKAINPTNSDGYTITIRHVHKPMEGVEVVVMYDPTKIAFSCEQFDAISQQKGLVFSFHHKDTLNQLNRKTDSIMNYASAQTTERPKIMLDFGHGGEDDGKVGVCGAKEKDITLKVGNKVARLLKKNGFQVFYTRTSDVFVPLDSRTTQANTKGVDIFVSIHANGAVNEAAQGIETYWLNPKLLQERTKISDNSVYKTVASLKGNSQSAHKLLASSLHDSVIKSARTRYPAKDRTVKEAIAQVLLGTDFTIPSALVEIGFLSNQDEGRLLTNDGYQQIIAQGIYNGITTYFNTLHAV